MEFWKEESSLYQIIKDHLDQEGYFDPDLIEDQNFVDTLMCTPKTGRI